MSVNQTSEQIEQWIAQISAQPRSGYSDLVHPTIFLEILQSNLPEPDKSVSRLKDEAAIVVGAGTLATSWALSIGTYHLLASPLILTKPKTELKSAMPDSNVTDPLLVLEELPYLNAVVEEAIRLSYGVASRLERSSPGKPLILSDSNSGQKWVIPPNTPVGTTSVLVHQDESILPDAGLFVPERWMENPRLDRCLIPFSKGSRQCLGIHLTYAEMCLCLAGIFSRFGSGGDDGVRMEGDEGVMGLYETGLSDVKTYGDGFVSLPAQGSQGVGTKVRN